MVKSRACNFIFLRRGVPGVVLDVGLSAATFGQPNGRLDDYGAQYFWRVRKNTLSQHDFAHFGRTHFLVISDSSKLVHGGGKVRGSPWELVVSHRFHVSSWTS